MFHELAKRRASGLIFLQIFYENFLWLQILLMHSKIGMYA